MTDLFNKSLQFKIRKQELDEIDEILYQDGEDLYAHRSSFIRVAIIREIKRAKERLNIKWLNK